MDALQLEEEEDAGAYLNDLNKAPDFVDEAPIEEVSARPSADSHFQLTDE